ncbi:MAG: hypothetical protein Kow00105_02740 [Phycisphaeraceae bacterium]
MYCPGNKQAIIYFEQGPVTLTLDQSYLEDQDTAREQAASLLDNAGVDYTFFEPTSFTAELIPDIPPNWSLMACPRVISEDYRRIGLGRIGPKVREIVKAARFSVFIPCGAYKPWQSVSAFFGGSKVGLRAVQLARDIADRAEVPMTVFTQLNDREHARRCRDVLEESGELAAIEHTPGWEWVSFETGTLKSNLMRVPHDSLAVVGAAGDSLIRELIFGSKLELIQSTLPNPILVVGPNADRRLLW